MQTKCYLAYGSNLNLSQMQARCPGAELLGYTFLRNYRLIFRGSRSGSYLSIDPAKGKSVPCGVFRITEADEKRLDVYEGYPRFYRKVEFQRLRLYSMDGECIPGSLTAMAYRLPDIAPAEMPARRYVETCLEGYRDFGFDIENLMDAFLNTLDEMD